MSSGQDSTENSLIRILENLEFEHGHFIPYNQQFSGSFPYTYLFLFKLKSLILLNLDER